MVLCINDQVYTGLWATLGSILGFFAFRRTPHMSPISLIGHCALSIGVGVLAAFPITEYLHEVEHLSKRLSMMLGAVGAFGLPDLILRHWKIFTTRVIDKAVDRVAHRIDDNDENEETSEEIVNRESEDSVEDRKE